MNIIPPNVTRLFRATRAWVQFAIGDIASRWPRESRVAGWIYVHAMQYPAHVGVAHNVGPFRERP